MYVTLHFKESMTPQVSLYALVAIWLLSMALGFKPITKESGGKKGPLSLGMEADAPTSPAPGNPIP